MTRQTASPRIVTAAERQTQAIAMRRAGASFPSIATQLGYASEAGARKAVNTVLARWAKENDDDAAALRALELARLDSYLAVIAAQLAIGHLGAIQTALKIGQRRAQLLGLDKPLKIAPTDPDGEKALENVTFYLPAPSRLRDDSDEGPGDGAEQA